jgi:hypothetical protein
MRRFLHVLLVSLFIGGGLPFLEQAVSRASNPACNPQIETESSHGRANVVEVWFKDLGTCDWQVPNGVAELHGVIVGGGGAGAGPNTNGNRGGDGGEVVDFTSNSLGSTLTIEVGVGGIGTRTANDTGGSGSASSIDNQGTVSIEDAPGANITSFPDALWWALASITTVGYGDRFPVTADGRMVAMFLMIIGIGLFGSLTALFAAWVMSEDRTAALAREN